MCDKGPVDLQDNNFNDILKYKTSPEVHTQCIRVMRFTCRKSRRKKIHWTATRWQPVDSVLTREMKV